jgi:hypothetical protein
MMRAEGFAPRRIEDSSTAGARQPASDGKPNLAPKNKFGLPMTRKADSVLPLTE